MPVKNKNRQSNSGYEGVITGLNDEEKKVLEDAGIGGGNDAYLVVNATLDNFILTEEEMQKLASGKYVGIKFKPENVGEMAFYNFEMYLNYYIEESNIYNFGFRLFNYNDEGTNRKYITGIDILYTSSEETPATITNTSYYCLDESADNILYKPTTRPSSQVLPSITTFNKQQNLTIGDGLKIENGALQATGGGGSSILRKDGTFVGKEDEFITINTISLTSEEDNKIKNGEITTIYGNFNLENGSGNPYSVNLYSNNNNECTFMGTDLTSSGGIITVDRYALTVNGENSMLFRERVSYPSIPSLPSDASTKTYTLKAINGTLTWVE